MEGLSEMVRIHLLQGKLQLTRKGQTWCSPYVIMAMSTCTTRPQSISACPQTDKAALLPLQLMAGVLVAFFLLKEGIKEKRHRKDLLAQMSCSASMAGDGHCWAVVGHLPQPVPASDILVRKQEKI